MPRPTYREMMGILPSGIHSSKEGLVFDLYDEELLEFLEAEYAKNVPLLERPGNERKIPPIVHFIWLGPKPFPEESVDNVRSWRKHNPSWELYFWTDSPKRCCPIEGMKKQLVQEYDFGAMQPLIELSTNWGEKSDLMRYVILDDMGGFYVDHDSDARHSFDPLLQFDSALCLGEPLWRGSINQSHVFFSNGQFGIAAHHPFLAKAMELVVQLWHELDIRYPDGNEPTPSWKVLRRTFDPFSIAVKELLYKSSHRKKYHDLVLPTCYFFPNRILSEEDMVAFEKQGVIWSRHTYAGLWADGAWGNIFLE